MSYTSISRKSLDTHWINTVCLTVSDCEILLPYIQKAYDSQYKKWEKYNDIHEGGEATSRQEDLRSKYSEAVDSLDTLLCGMKQLIKDKENQK